MGWVQFRSSVYIGGMLNMVEKDSPRIHVWLGGGFKDFFVYTPILGEMSIFDEHIFCKRVETTN